MFPRQLWLGVMLRFHPSLGLIALGKAGSVLVCSCLSDGVKVSVSWCLLGSW